MKKFIILFVAIIPFMACKTDASKQETKADAPVTTEKQAEIKADTMHIHTYVCPMHPEVKGSKEGEKCPKCGMALEHHN